MRPTRPCVLPTRALRSVIFSLAALLAVPVSARAGNCDSAAGLSTCFDANSLWLPGHATTFVTIADTRTIPTGRFVFGIAGEYLHHPLTLQVSSPDRDGREVQVLSDAVDSSYVFGFGLWPEFELSVALPCAAINVAPAREV